MPGRGKGAKRSRAAASTPSASPFKRNRPENEDEETLDILSTEHEASCKTGNLAKQNNRFVDFELLLKEQEIIKNNCSTLNCSTLNLFDKFPEESPEMVRCGGDEIALHVPDQIKQKIIQHKYINLSVLLKGAVELSEMYNGGVLQLNNTGQLESRPRSVSDKIGNIEKWTDAFLVYCSVYLKQYPERTLEILHYMSIIREAAYKHGGFSWRLYDEQFRLRQALSVSPWNKLNPDLWLRCFAGTSNALNQSNQKVQIGNPPKCIDFNKGNCKWSNCRYSHLCSECSSQLHGKWACPNVKTCKELNLG